MWRSACCWPKRRPQCGHGTRSSNSGGRAFGGGKSFKERPSFWYRVTTRDSLMALRNASDFTRQLFLTSPPTGLIARSPGLPFSRLAARLPSCWHFKASSGALCSTALNFFRSFWNTLTHKASCLAFASGLNVRAQCLQGKRRTLGPASPSASIRGTPPARVGIGGDAGRPDILSAAAGTGGDEDL